MCIYSDFYHWTYTCFYSSRFRVCVLSKNILKWLLILQGQINIGGMPCNRHSSCEDTQKVIMQHLLCLEDWVSQQRSRTTISFKFAGFRAPI